MKRRAIDITGKKFGRLTADRDTGMRTKGGNAIWECSCKCGAVIQCKGSDLRTGHTTSCGCWVSERAANHAKQIGAANKTHGMSGSKIYRVWRAMLNRCYREANADYERYGGRGIRVCERWHTFENFYADMGDPPNGLSLDRHPENDGDYEPGNCRWATSKQQAANRRSRRLK